MLITTLSMIATLSNATNYYSQVSGVFATTTNWNSNSGGGGTNPSNFTTIGDSFFIQSAHTMTGSVTSVAGVILTIHGSWTTAGGTVGYININPTGSISLGATLNVKNNWTNNGSFTSTASTVVFNGTTVQTLESGGTGSGKVFRSITFSNTSQPVTLTNDLAVTVTLSISASSALSAGSYSIYIGTTWSNSGTFNPGTSNVILNGTGTQTLTTGGNGAGKTFYDFTINKTAGIVTLNGNLQVANNFNFVSSSGILNAQNFLIGFSSPGKTCTINGNLQTSNLNGFAGTASTTILNTNSPTIILGTSSIITYTAASGIQTITNTVDYANLTKSGNSSGELAGDIIVNGYINLAAGGGTLSTTSNNYNIQLGGNWTNNASFSPGTSTVTLTGTSVQSLNTGGTGTGKPFYNLVINKSSGTVSLTNNLMMNNDLTLTSGTLICSTFTIDFSATGKNCIINGSLQTANLNGFSGGAATSIVNTSAPTITLGANSMITYTATSGNQTVTNALPYVNFAKTGAGGTALLAGDITVNGNLTLTSGILNTNNYNIDLLGNWSNTGTFTPGTGTVNFVGTSNQTITTGGTTTGKIFNNITINNSAGVVSLAGNISISNNLSITTGELDVTATNHNITIGGNWSNSGTFTPRGGLVTFNGTSSTITTGGIGAGKSFNSITFNNTAGTFTLNGDLKSNSNLTIATGLLDATTSNYNIYVGGNWVNNGSFAPNSGTVTFDGTVDQSINSGGIAKPFNNVTINNTSA
jgi:fibronectin-binding autotransporter adhesin